MYIRGGVNSDSRARTEYSSMIAFFLERREVIVGNSVERKERR